jgi:RimJ/RimL family protein N-acetyltransferase
VLHQLSKDEYSSVQQLFERLPRTTVAGTLAGLTPGRVYVDDPRNPKAGFTWGEFRFSYLVGDPQDDEFAVQLAALLEDELLPKLPGSHDPTLVIYPDSPAWIDALEERLAAYHPLRLFRSRHRFEQQAFEAQARELEALPPGYTLQPVDSQICGRFPELVFAYELLWGGVQNFLAHGFGYCVLADGELASACDSPFCAGGRAEIGVETKEAHRRKGLARQAATRFIAESLMRGLEPSWECWWENEASRCLAARLGFDWLEDYPVLFIEMPA